MAGQVADGLKVLLSPAFLQADNLGRWRCGGDLAADFCEARVAVLGEEFEAPAVERDDAKGAGEGEEIVVHGCFERRGCY